MRRKLVQSGGGRPETTEFELGSDELLGGLGKYVAVLKYATLPWFYVTAYEHRLRSYVQYGYL